MNATHVRSACTGLALLAATPVGPSAFQAPPSAVLAGATRSSSGNVSSTVVANLVARGERLVVLVLWRGSPGWLTRGGASSSRGGGGGNGRTWVQLSRGGLTLDLEMDDATGVARLAGQDVSLQGANVLLVDHVDTEPEIVGTMFVDPAVPASPDAMYAVLKREPALQEFLQCDLMRADPLLQQIRPEYFQAMMANHPCGG